MCRKMFRLYIVLFMCVCNLGFVVDHLTPLLSLFCALEQNDIALFEIECNLIYLLISTKLS